MPKSWTTIPALPVLGMLAVLLSLTPASADDCETPLPDEVTVRAPGPDVPPEYGKFSGTWRGEWKDVLCHNLVVEEVGPDGSVRAIYSWGTYAGWNIYKGFTEASGRIVDGKLKLDRFGNGAEVTYWFSGPDLKGEYVRRGRTTKGGFSKISD